MKRILYIIIAILACVACSRSEIPCEESHGTVTVTFNVSGDFTLSTNNMTRSLTADGKDMTDLWVLDYQNGVLAQQLHQTSSDTDFGQPTLDLTLGAHHVYFIASRGSGATLNNTDKTITFTKVLDTFWKDYEITVSSGSSSASRSVALDRVVTKLKLVFSDAIPTGAAMFNISPTAWYYGFNYQTGEPSAVTTSQPIPVNIPSTEIGVVNETVSIFGFSSITEWATDIDINCKTNNNDVLGSAVITAAPFVRNRVSEYTGPLFSNYGAMTLSLNVTWDDIYQGTW